MRKLIIRQCKCDACITFPFSARRWDAKTDRNTIGNFNTWERAMRYFRTVSS